MKEMRVVFMGTPEFAVESLKVLVEHQVNVVGVITAPDKPKGRGKQLGMSAVKQYALDQGLNILQPTNLKDPGFIEELKALQADIQIVVAFRMLPEIVWSMPPSGTFNLHASLLPQYRGAAPINWAIINGEKETGVTTFFLQHAIDTGNIILQEKEPIYPDDNAGTLYQRLMSGGANLVLKTLQLIETGTYTLHPQSGSDLKEAPKIFRDDCQIDWNRPAEEVHNFIRGLSPYPAAWTLLNDKVLKIFESEWDDANMSPGELVTDNKTYLKYGCQAGAISIMELQLEGKKRMPVTEFLKGYTI